MNNEVQDELFAEAMQQLQRPSIIMKPTIWRSGDIWRVAHMGPDEIISNDLCGEGKTCAEAMDDYDKVYYGR